MTTRILIAEDEAVTALDLKRELIALGYEVTGIADNASDAVNAAAAQKPDLVLMDIHLSGSMDGIVAACRHRSPRVPLPPESPIPRDPGGGSGAVLRLSGG